MRFFDLHCDTITELHKSGGELRQNSGHISLDRAEYLSEYVQDFAIFIPDEFRGKAATDYFDSVYAYYKAQLQKNNISEYSQQIDTKFKSVLSVEGGAAMGGTIEGLHHLADCNVKLITITWNGRNELASGCFDDEDIGLTDFGRTAIKEMESLGIAADVSHLSLKGFYDLADIAEKPFMASHSCRNIVDNFRARHRNLNDDQIKIIAERGGVIGINLWEKLLSNDEASFDSVLRHMSGIIEIGGEDCIAMGTDFDGCDIHPTLAGIEKMQDLGDYLCAHGFNNVLIDKIFYKNASVFFNNLLFTK